MHTITIMEVIYFFGSKFLYKIDLLKNIAVIFVSILNTFLLYGRFAD